MPKEIYPNERRVALTPNNVALLRKKGFGRVLVEKDAGLAAKYPNDFYEYAGATVVDSVWAESDIVLKVRPLSAEGVNDEVSKLKEGAAVISFMYAAQNKKLVDALAAKHATSFAMEQSTFF